MYDIQLKFFKGENFAGDFRGKMILISILLTEKQFFIEKKTIYHDYPDPF